MSNEKNLAVSKDIDAKVMEVMSTKIQGFEKAFIISSAISALRDNLTPEFMKPIMDLQGSRLGFLTDKHKKGQSYTMEQVKTCLIDAVLLGLQPTGNQFNIISGNMYPTREGFGYLLDNIKQLRKSFDFLDVDLREKSKVSYVTVEITWKIGDEEPKKQKIKFPVKSDAYTSHDALIGKAERKAKRWLFNTLKGTDIADADVEDIPHKVVSTKVDGDEERILLLINSAKNQEDLDFAREHCNEEHLPLIKAKQVEINKTNK